MGVFYKAAVDPGAYSTNYIEFFPKIRYTPVRHESTTTLHTPKLDIDVPAPIPVGYDVFDRRLSQRINGFIALAKQKGFNLQITSSYRDKRSENDTSFHPKGEAIDLSAKTDMKALLADPDIREYMQTNGLGVIREISPEEQIRYGATGPNYHIGPDKHAIIGLSKLLQEYNIS